MPENHEVTFSDLKVDDIRGGVTLDATTEYSSKWKDVYRALRELGPKLREDFGFRASPRTNLRDSLSAGRGPERVASSEAAQVSEELPRPIVMKCEDPDFMMGVDSGNIRFLFDAVQSPDESLKALKCFLDVVLDKLAPVDLSGFEIVFQHIFYLQPGTKNFEVLANALLKGQASAAGFFQAFGDDIDWGRTDLAWVYHRRNSELIRGENPLDLVSPRCPTG